jgi:VWFA-related protein
MHAMCSRLGLAAILTLVGLPLSAQESPSRLPPAEAHTVLVDVIVRDGRGQPVTDLSASEFQVLEDDVPQRIERFSPPPQALRGAVAEPSAAERPVELATSLESSSLPPAADRASQHATVAFVFDRLSTEGRVAAQRAVRAALAERRPRDVFGVFSIENALVVLQDFTSDAPLLLAAVEALGSRAAQSGPSSIDAARASAGQRLATAEAQARLLDTPRPRTAAEGLARSQAQILATRLSVAQAAADAFERLARDEAGQATAHALTAIVDALRAVPGRKSVVLFSEGLFRTEANEQRFRSVVHSANRASVSVYAVEAAGLQTTSYESLTAREIQSTALLSMARQTAGADDGGGAFTRDMEAVEDSVRYHPRASLQWIADATGGTFVRDTNDLPGSLGRIASDARSYYLLGYTPSDTGFDGRFRRIKVRVTRRGVDVRSRSGYFAVRSQGPVLAHVAPALALLEAGKTPRDIGVHAGAWPFPGDSQQARVPVVVSVPAAAVGRLARGRKGRLDVTLLARFVDAQGQAVEAMSRRVVFEPRRPADVLMLRDAWLPAGRYRLEAVAYEAGSGRAGVASSEIEVREGGCSLDRAQLLIVHKAVAASEAPEELPAGHPLRFGEVMLQPVAGAPIARRPPRPLVVQLAATDFGPRETGSAELEVLQAGRSVVKQSLPWPSPSEGSGLRRQVVELPFANAAAGSYELRLTLSEAGRRRVLVTPFELTDEPVW